MRASAAVCKVGMDLKNDSVAFPFSLLGPGIPSLFSPPTSPQSSYPTLVGVIGIYIYMYTYA